MRKLLMLTTILLSFSGVNAQSQNDLANMSARICQTDSITKVIAVYNEDSLMLYHFQTPDYNTYGAPSYEYEKFDLIFDVSSKLLFNQVPFGKIDVVEFGKKSSRIVVEIAGAGNRIEKGLWTFAVYDFSRSKGSPWQLQGVNYYFEDYFKGKKID